MEARPVIRVPDLGQFVEYLPTGLADVPRAYSTNELAKCFPEESRLVGGRRRRTWDLSGEAKGDKLFLFAGRRRFSLQN